MKTELTRDNYQEQHYLAIARATMIYKLIEDMPLSDLLTRIETADAIGPLLDPTLWMRKNKALNEDRDMIAALRGFQAAMSEIKKACEEEGASLR